MKIVRKKGLEKPRLVHNKKLFWVIIGLGIILIILIIFVVMNGKSSNSGNNQNNSSENECVMDSDCVPLCGCHPNSCVSISKKPECERVICTQECSGPLDCGAGSCDCLNGKCSVISNQK